MPSSGRTRVASRALRRQDLGKVRVCLVGDDRASEPGGCGAGTALRGHVGVEAHDWFRSLDTASPCVLFCRWSRGRGPGRLGGGAWLRWEPLSGCAWMLGLLR